MPGRSWSVRGGGGGGLAAKISHLGAEGAIVAPQLVANRGSGTPWTREAMAQAVVADMGAHCPEAVVTLAISHADCEGLADRIRARSSKPSASALTLCCGA